MKQLEKLEYSNGRIFELEVASDGKTISITEACDMCFSVAFNKKEFGELLKELKEIHSKMNDIKDYQKGE